MFEFGRELRRLFGGARVQFPGKDGLTGGDGALLELLDLKMLKAEAKGADVAAGRIGVRDRARRLLEAAIVWRELARRTGNAEALRKAAATAEKAAETYAGAHRQQGWSRARLEQARCALLGAELFGDSGLEAAAETAASEAQRVGGAAGMLAMATLAQIKARRTLSSGGPAEARAAARLFNDPIAMLEGAGRRDPHLKLAGADARMVRCELLVGAGLRLKDEDLIRAALGDLTAAEERLDAAYEPLALARIAIAKASAKAALGEMTGDLARLARSISALATALDALGREQSPLDWARGQTSLGRALAQLGEATENETAFAKALSCYDRAGVVLRDEPGLVLRAEVANGRGLALARLAELTGDARVLDKAEAAFKAELIAGPHRTDPVTWAMLQVQLGQVYVTRLNLTGRDRGERAAAAMAFQAAIDVFGEEGLRSLSAIACEGLERLAAAKVS